MVALASSPRSCKPMWAEPGSEVSWVGMHAIRATIPCAIADASPVLDNEAHVRSRQRANDRVAPRLDRFARGRKATDVYPPTHRLPDPWVGWTE